MIGSSILNGLNLGQLRLRMHARAFFEVDSEWLPGISGAAALCLPPIPKVRALIMSLRQRSGAGGCGAHELMRSRKGHSNNGQSSERTERGERTENVGSKISNIGSRILFAFLDEKAEEGSSSHDNAINCREDYCVRWFVRSSSNPPLSALNGP